MGGVDVRAVSLLTYMIAECDELLPQLRNSTGSATAITCDEILVAGKPAVH